MSAGPVRISVTAGPTSDGIVARPAGPADLAAVAHVLVAAFPGEFHLLFGSRRGVAEEAILHLLCCDYPEGRGAWVAGDGDGIIGAMLLEAPPQSQPQRSWRLAWHVACRHVGLRGLPRLAVALLMPRYAVGTGEAYVRAIGVLPNHRGRGAGTQLLRCAEDWGRQHYKVRLGLHVHSENPEAHALYRRMGYADRSYRSSLVTWITLRQRGTYYMTRPLREAEP